MPRNLIFEAIFFVSPGRQSYSLISPSITHQPIHTVYVNSLLATLNARDRLREQSAGVVTIHISRLLTRGVDDAEAQESDEKVRYTSRIDRRQWRGLI